MNHESENELLSAYLDGELTADQRAQVEQLLERKPAARKLLEELRALSVTLKSLPRHKVGEDLSEIVLRMAERRMLTEPADAEKTGTDTSAEPIREEKMETEKKGTGAATEPAPVYSTILRRLKNPRMWVWEIVIVAVAVMLVVYYPNQNANRNAAVPENAERDIAMATKPEEKPTSSPQSSMWAAPSPAKVDMKETLDVQIVRGKRSDTTVQTGVALRNKQPVAPNAYSIAGKQSVAPGGSALAGKQPVATDAPKLAEPVAPGEATAPQRAGEEVGKTDASGRLEGLGKMAENKSAAAPEMPARGMAELAKKDGTTSGDKLATEGMPKVSLKAANGAAPAADSPAPTSIPAAGLAIPGQSKSGTDQIAQNINASEAPSQSKPAEPPAEKEPADRSKGRAASADELLVVRCEITPEALKNHAFDKILADNAIVWSETRKEAEKEKLDAENLPKPETIQSLLGTETGHAANKPEEAELSKDAGDNIALSDTAPLELVYVEASPAQIQSMLNALKAQTKTFKTVSVAPAKGDSRLQNAVAGFNYRGVMARGAGGGRANVALSAESLYGGFQTEVKADSSASAGAVLGRAERIPYSYGYNAKAADLATEAQKQNPANTAQKGLPATMGFGGRGGGGRWGGSGKSMPGGQSGVAAGTAPTTSSGTAEQLKSSAQALNQPAAKAEQAPAAAAASQLLTNRNQEQAANQEDQPAQVAESRRSAKQEQQPASAAHDRQDVESLRREIRIEPTGTAGLPRIERVLFVLQVIERKNAAENAEKNAPADAAGVKVPAVEANPSKP